MRDESGLADMRLAPTRRPTPTWMPRIKEPAAAKHTSYVPSLLFKLQAVASVTKYYVEYEAPELDLHGVVGCDS